MPASVPDPNAGPLPIDEVDGDAPLDVAQTDAAEESDVEHYTFKVSKTLTRRIDQYLVDRVPYLSRANVQRLIAEGLVKVNGRVIKPAYKLQAGETVVMVAPPKPVSELVPEDIPLDIVYEDDYFLALNKQANLMIHPARGKWTGTLVNGLVHYGNKWSKVTGEWRPGILHRLDKNTTGIMLVAKADEAHWRLARQFENRTIQKNYVAVIHGVPEMISDVIDMPIGRDRFVREKQAVRKIENGGKQAITKFEVKETFEAHPDAQFVDSPFAKDKHYPKPPEKFSFLQLWPKTGRTHQLRVHTTAIGHPMVGDTMYGGRVFTHGDFRFERQALHAYEITFVHPISLETMTLRAPLPPDMTRLMEILRAGKQTTKNE